MKRHNASSLDPRAQVCLEKDVGRLEKKYELLRQNHNHLAQLVNEHRERRDLFADLPYPLQLVKGEVPPCNSCGVVHESNSTHAGFTMCGSCRND